MISENILRLASNIILNIYELLQKRQPKSNMTSLTSHSPLFSLFLPSHPLSPFLSFLSQQVCGGTMRLKNRCIMAYFLPTTATIG